MAEIACEWQFTDSGYFTRFFRKQTSLSPGAYRAKAYRRDAPPKAAEAEPADWPNGLPAA